jgi:hypothetical protein
MQDKTNWQTSDLPAAAYAIYRGLRLMKVTKGNRAVFAFETGTQWNAFLQEYLAGNALVEPGRFHLCLKSARAAVLDQNLRRAQEQAFLAHAVAGGWEDEQNRR